jgi:hypothetical protein
MNVVVYTLLRGVATRRGTTLLRKMFVGGLNWDTTDGT